MKYRVIKQFADSHDGLYVYQAGDSFPRNGLQVGESRISELLGENNALGVPVIEKLDEHKEESVEAHADESESEKEPEEDAVKVEKEEQPKRKKATKSK